MPPIRKLTTFFARAVAGFGKTEWLVVLLLLVASFLRLWNIPNTVQFLGDQGRDAMIVADIFLKLDPVFIGPVTSVGNMYLGPLYYYFMAPFLFLSFPSPLGPVYAVALLSIVTVFLLYALGTKMLGQRPALIAMGLFAIAAVVVSGSRFSWNPNLAPLVSLLIIFFTHQALVKNPKYWAYALTAFAVIMQLHYMALLSAAGMGILWLYHGHKLAIQEKNKKLFRNFLQATGIGACIVLLSLSPLVLFDFKHGFINQKGLIGIFTKESSFEGEATSALGRIGELLIDTHGRSMHILFDIGIGQRRALNTVLVLITLGIFSAIIWSGQKRKHHEGELVIFVFLLTGIVGTSAYQHSLFDHYIAYLFPISFLSLGIIGNELIKRGILGKIGMTAFFALFIYHNAIQNQQVLKPVGWKLSDIQRTAQTISAKVSENEKYNIVLLTGTGDIDGQNYRYFLHVSDKPPVPIEQRGEVETLFIINEDKVLDKVTDSPIYEIVVFPNKEPAEVYEVPDGPTITVLRKNP